MCIVRYGTIATPSRTLRVLLCGRSVVRKYCRTTSTSTRVGRLGKSCPYGVPPTARLWLQSVLPRTHRVTPSVPPKSTQVPRRRSTCHVSSNSEFRCEPRPHEPRTLSPCLDSHKPSPVAAAASTRAWRHARVHDAICKLTYVRVAPCGTTYRTHACVRMHVCGQPSRRPRRGLTFCMAYVARCVYMYARGT